LYTGREPETLEHAALDSDGSRVQVLVNRTPWWDEGLGAFVLNFGGRITRASIKNYQLVPADSEVAIGLQGQQAAHFIVSQFGRIDEHEFHLDITPSMSVLQGFGVALTALVHKRSC
jgi:tubby-related protein 1